MVSRPGNSRLDGEHGRGLTKIAALADTFSHHADTTGQTVWAEAGWCEG
jgi:hypothetical protein